MRTSVSPPRGWISPANGPTLIAGSDEFYLTGFELFRDFCVIEGRKGGLDQVEIRYY